jgi:curved DNA-binding protein CbpA
MPEARCEPRKPCRGRYSLTWRSRDGKSYSTEASGLDVSSSGLGIESSCELKAGSIVYVQAEDGSLKGDCEVVHCTPRGLKFHVGFELREEAKPKTNALPRPNVTDRAPDHYETLQISYKADAQTIHRVYRMMAARFHPDNPETGDVEKFLRMNTAYAVLSDPTRRMEYDATLEKNREVGPRPIFALKEFVTDVKAEANRRLGVLSLLYNRRQTNPDHPGLSVLDLEREMGFPREYLSFTLWYLLAKSFIGLADNSDYALTAAGVDYVERKAARNAIMGRLLNPGAYKVQPFSAAARRDPKTGSESKRFLLPPPPARPGVTRPDPK